MNKKFSPRSHKGTKFFLFFFVPLCLSGLLFFAACAAPTPTALPATPTPDTRPTAPVLIAEVLGGIPGNNNYDYIELTNPTAAAPFDLNGISLWYQLADNGEAELVYRWDAPALIPPRGSYLLGRADQDYGLPVDAYIDTPFVPQRGGLQLRAANGSVLDTLVWGRGPQNDFDSTPAPPMENGVALTLAALVENGFTLNDTSQPQNTAFASDIQLTLGFPETVQAGEEFTCTLTLSNTGTQPINNITAQVPIPDEFKIISLPPNAEINARAAFFGLDALAETHHVIRLPIVALAAGETRVAEITLKAPWAYLTVTTANTTVASAEGVLLAQGSAARTAVAGGAIPIGTARTLVDQEIVVEGIATMYTGGYFAGSGNTKFYLEDETGGLQVWVDDGEGDVNVLLGDRVRVRGLLLLYRGAMELAPTPDGVEIIEKGSPETDYPPMQVSVQDAALDSENLAGRLIQAQGAVARVEEFTYSHEIDLVDPEGHLTNIYVDKLTAINMQSIQSGETYTITGVMEVTDGRPVIYPRIQADLAKVYPPVLEITLSAPVNIQVGEAFTVLLTVTNHTPNALQDVVITAPLPAFDLGVQEISDGGVQAGKIITWTLSELTGDGGAASVSYQAKVETSEAAVRLEAVRVSAPGVDSAESAALDLFIGAQVPIWAIQGAGKSSPYTGERVTTTGMVTGIFPELEGFWIQALQTDYNSLTSDGLFIYSGAWLPEVLPGDVIEVSGVVGESYSQTQLAIAAREDVLTLHSASALPAAIELNPPLETEAALTYYESLEGMFVQVTQAAIAVAPTNRYGEFTLVRSEHGINRLWQGEESGIAIRVDDGSSAVHEDRSTLPYAVNSGDEISNLIGPLAYTYGLYKIEPVTTPTRRAAQNDLPTLTPLADDEFSLMTWNVENLFDFTDPHPASPPMPGIDEYRTQIAKVVNTILAAGAPTVIGLQEVENIGILEDIAGHESLAEYSYLPVLIEGSDSRYIDVGYLVRGDQAQILHEEQFPAPEGLTSRPPLLVQVQIGAITVSILNNHFTAMSGGEAATEPRRNAQAAWNVTLISEILAGDENARLAVMGDLNSYYNALPIDTLREAGLLHVLDALPPEARYTYIYEGRSQVLDHILVTPSLMEMLRRVEILHVNADYALPAPDDTSPLHKSDHDPVVAVFGD